MSTERRAAAGRLWLKVRTFLAGQAELREARRQAAGPAWNRVGSGLVIAALIWSATYFLVSYPQAALQIEADSVAFTKLNVESQQLSDFTKAIDGLSRHLLRRDQQMGVVLANGALEHRKARERLRSEIVNDELGAASDLGKVTPFEDIGFDWSQAQAKSLAGSLNAELGLWYAEEDLVDAYSNGAPSASRTRSARRRVERQLIVYRSKLSQVPLANKETIGARRDGECTDAGRYTAVAREVDAAPLQLVVCCNNARACLLGLGCASEIFYAKQRKEGVRCGHRPPLG